MSSHDGQGIARSRFAPAVALAFFLLAPTAGSAPIRLAGHLANGGGGTQLRFAIPEERTRMEESTAREFVRSRAALLGLSPDEMTLEDVRRPGHLVHHYYRQRFEGWPVIGGVLRFTFSEDGDLIYFSSTAVSDLAVPDVAHTIPLLDAQARAWTGMEAPRSVQWLAGSRAVLPAQMSGLDEDRLVWELRCRTSDPFGAWRIRVDATGGEVLERVSLIYAAETHVADRVSGNVRARFNAPTPWGPEVEEACPDLEITAWVDGRLHALGFTDADGGFDFGDLPGGALALRAPLSGRFARIHPIAIANAPDTLTQHAPALPVEMVWDSSAVSPSALAAYIHVHHAHASLHALDPAFSSPGFPGLEQPLPVVVDDTLGACNAYAVCLPEAPEIHFLAPSDPCAPTAQIADVAYHEYAHLITLYAYLPDFAPAHFHEAFSDYFAASLTDTSLIGRDFNGWGTYLRDLQHDLAEPVSDRCRENPYCFGLLLSGAWWDIRSEFIRTLGDREFAVHLADSLVHFGRYGKPIDFESMLIEMLLVDDDDHDLANGTPHLDEITHGFARHNLSDFSVDIFHRPLADVEDPTAPLEVKLAIGSIFPLDRESLRLFYSVDGRPFHTEPLEGSGPEYAAQIPEQPSGSSIRYYFEAADTRGHFARLPDDAPNRMFRVRVGPDGEPPLIVHGVPPAPLTGQAAVWISAVVSDNGGVIDSVVVDYALDSGGGEEVRRSRPLACKLELESGTLYQTDLEIGPLAPSQRLRYLLRATDGSRGANRSRHPASGDHFLAARTGRAWDFERDAHDVRTTGEWEVGEPLTESPPPETSGKRVAGTALGGSYSPNRRSELTLGPVDLSGWTHATLEFSSWYRTEAGYDGGYLRASSDGGASWHDLIPLSGYPDEIYTEDGSELRPAFAGSSGGWRTVRAVLDDCVGSSVWLQFVFWSDAAVTDLGWYLDDIRLADEPCLPPPLALNASRGEDRRVTLSWTAPDVDPAPSATRIYRGVTSSDLALQVELPAATQEWIDTQVVNGTRYYYAVAAVYAEGESWRGAEVVGHPYRAAIAPPLGINRTLRESESPADTIFIANQGTGVLTLDFYPAASPDEWESLRPVCDLSIISGAPFRTIARDGPDDSDPDLEYLAYRRINDNLLFRIGLHDPAPDPASDFTVYLYLDTDLSIGSGRVSATIGGDFIAVLGKRALDLFTLDAFIADSAMRFVDLPASVIVRKDLDSLEVAVPLCALGWPHEIACAVEVERYEQMDGEFEAIRGDRLPDTDACSWLEVPACGRAQLGEPFPLALRYRFDDDSRDEFEAKIFIATNDPALPVLELPVMVHRSGESEGLRFAFDAPRPTPFRDEALLRLHLPAGELWRLDIVDVSGRVIRRLGEFRANRPEIRLVAWDGRDDDGRRVAQGIYHAVARLGGRQLSRPVVLIR